MLDLTLVSSSNLKGGPQVLSDKQYVKRGNMENRIKKQQLMLFSDGPSCDDFAANQFRLLLSSFSYVLVQHLRQDHLAGTELACAQTNAIGRGLEGRRPRYRFSPPGSVPPRLFISLRIRLPVDCPVGSDSAWTIKGNLTHR